MMIREGKLIEDGWDGYRVPVPVLQYLLCAEVIHLSMRHWRPSA